MHGLHLAAHAVTVALHEHGRDRVNDARDAGRPLQLAMHHSPYAVAPMGAWIDRMSASENTARSYLTGRLQALTGEAIPPGDDPGRLAHALAAWDIQCHRALARDPAPSDVLLITRTQGLIAGASMVLVDAATTAGVLDPLGPTGPRDSRSRPRMEQPSQPLGRPGTARRPPRGVPGARGR